MLNTELTFYKEVHMRPLQAIVAAVLKFKSSVVASIDGVECNARSLLDLIDAVAKAKDRSKIHFVVSGEDAAEAIEALNQLPKTITEFTQDICSNA